MCVCKIQFLSVLETSQVTASRMQQLENFKVEVKNYFFFLRKGCFVNL